MTELKSHRTKWNVNLSISISDLANNEKSNFRKLYTTSAGSYWKSEDIDFNFPLDPENPLGMDDSFVPISDSDLWRTLPQAQKAVIRRNFQAWQLSQVIHGEYVTMVCASRIALSSDDPDEKACAALQAVDEYKHLELFKNLLGKIGPLFPPSKQLSALFDEIILSEELDFVNIGLQTLVEGLALTFFRGIQSASSSQEVRRMMSMISRDEARHFAAGQIGARQRAKALTSDQIVLRKNFILKSLRLLDEYLYADDLWGNIGLDKEACAALARGSEVGKSVHSDLFNRLSQAIETIGLMNDEIAEFFARA